MRPAAQTRGRQPCPVGEIRVAYRLRQLQVQQYARIRETGESIRGEGDEIEAKEGEFNPYFARAYPFMNLTFS